MSGGSRGLDAYVRRADAEIARLQQMVDSGQYRNGWTETGARARIAWLRRQLDGEGKR